MCVPIPGQRKATCLINLKLPHYPKLPKARVRRAKAPADLKAMALFNRALTYSSTREYAKAQEDLKKVLELPQLAPDVKGAARLKLERMKKRVAAPEESE